MKVDDAVETLTRFFNDLVGTLIPGGVLVLGLATMHLGPGKVQSVGRALESWGPALAALTILFAVGHGLLAFHSTVLEPLLSQLKVTKPFNQESAMTRQSFVLFQKLISSHTRVKEVMGEEVSNLTWTYNDLRNVALSISTEASSLGRRFMFIALLCHGVGAAIVLMLVDYLVCVFFAPNILFPYLNAWPVIIQVVLMLLVAGMFFRRGEAFNSRAMTTPFSVAVADLIFRPASHEPKN